LGFTCEALVVYGAASDSDLRKWGVNIDTKANDEKSKEVSSRVEKWFDELDKFNSVPFLFDRQQRLLSERKIFDESDGD
jgi:hypothetical protein